MNLELRPNGVIHPEDLKLYDRGLKDNRETRKGGVLCGKTGNAERDALSARLKEEGYSKGILKGIIPCRYLGTEVGYCDGPFLHDGEAASFTRGAILKKRRNTFDQARTHPIRKQIQGDRVYCANPECMEPWTKDQLNSPLQNWSRCKFTMYINTSLPESRKKDWKRHKEEPCALIDEVVEKDDLWNCVGTQAQLRR
ncbi:hypothetical protein BT96DRAFT_1038612 [Gymnopus androsaceus JB14]|uniref:Uncharacterized protein n=1 Tax=Gymnopus androsaceus JB14 TaxID=1447944 RepID=A0A6A4HEK1_9AGAR|nr:hypothetical protein BT96DRAFT_1038612 [Gymnopus androsaceus JB14]